MYPTISAGLFPVLLVWLTVKEARSILTTILRLCKALLLTVLFEDLLCFLPEVSLWFWIRKPLASLLLNKCSDCVIGELLEWILFERGRCADSGLKHLHEFYYSQWNQQFLPSCQTHVCVYPHLLFKSFKKEKLLISRPVSFKKWKIQFIDDSILLGELILVGEARATVVNLFDHDLGGFGDIALAIIALYLIGGIEYVLDRERCT